MVLMFITTIVFVNSGKFFFIKINQINQLLIFTIIYLKILEVFMNFFNQKLKNYNFNFNKI